MALEQVRGKATLNCSSSWFSEQWQLFGVEEFLDIGAVQKLTQCLEELDHYRDLEVYSLLGTEWQPD